MKSEICSSFGEGKSYYKTRAEYAGCQVVCQPASLYCLSLWSQLGHPGSSAGLGSARSQVQRVVGPGVTWAHLSRRCLEWLSSAPIFPSLQQARPCPHAERWGRARTETRECFQARFWVTFADSLLATPSHALSQASLGAELKSEWGRSLQNRTGLPCCLPQVLLSGPVPYSRILGALTLRVFDPLCLFRQ